MVVAFLDLLGFSELLDLSTEVALDNINLFNNVIKTKVIDYATHPIEEYEDKNPGNAQFMKFVTNSAVTSFEYLISFSDSLIIGSQNLLLFIEQLSNFLSTVYISSSEPFRLEFEDLFNVDSNKNMSFENGKIRKHKAFPVLFRGGLSYGDDVFFFKENSIQKGKFCYDGYNVFGKTYLNSVKLEHAGKGPRLFCDKSVIDNLTYTSMIRIVDENNAIYEIVWTVEACEVSECSSDKWNNVIKSICEKLLPAAINFVIFYSSDSKYSEVLLQYNELLKLVCRGIVRYADINCNKAQEAMELINKRLHKKCLNQYTIDEMLHGFL